MLTTRVGMAFSGTVRDRHRELWPGRPWWGKPLFEPVPRCHDDSSLERSPLSLLGPRELHPLFHFLVQRFEACYLIGGQTGHDELAATGRACMRGMLLWWRRGWCARRRPVEIRHLR